MNIFYFECYPSFFFCTNEFVDNFVTIKNLRKKAPVEVEKKDEQKTEGNTPSVIESTTESTTENATTQTQSETDN